MAVYWIAHLNSTRRLERFDWPVTLANLIFLGFLSLLPYATAWLGADLSGRTAWTVYSATLVVISAANMALLGVLLRGGERLVGGLRPGERLLRLVRAGSPGLAFLLCLALAQAGWMTMVMLCPLLIPVLVLGTSRLIRRTVQKAA